MTLQRADTGPQRLPNAARRRTIDLHRVSAFTLIEVLLAIAIFSIVLVAINTVFIAGVHLQQRVSDSVEQALPLDHALGVLRRDLQSAVPPGGVLAGNFSSDGPRGPSTAALNKGISSSGSMAGQNGGLDFCTASGIITESAPWGDIQEVNYQLMEPLDRANANGRDLVRTVTRNLLGSSSQVSEMQRLAGNIRSLDFSFYDGTQWRDVWDTTAGDTGLPTAVKISLQLAPDDTASSRALQPLEMVVLLESQSVTNQTQTAGGMQ